VTRNAMNERARTCPPVEKRRLGLPAARCSWYGNQKRCALPSKPRGQRNRSLLPGQADTGNFMPTQRWPVGLAHANGTTHRASAALAVRFLQHEFLQPLRTSGGPAGRRRSAILQRSARHNPLGTLVATRERPASPRELDGKHLETVNQVGDIVKRQAETAHPKVNRRQHVAVPEDIERTEVPVRPDRFQLLLRRVCNSLS